jgi:O-antigen ligase
LRNKKILLTAKSLIGQYTIAFIIGIMAGFKLIPTPVIAVLYLALCVVCLIRAFQVNLPGLFSVLPYVMYTEVLIRANARWIPYLSVQYLIIAVFSILLIKGARLKKSHSYAYFFLVMFTFLELANNIYPDKKDITRAIITNSCALLIPVIWASFNVLKPVLINRFFNNVKIAAVYLAGIVFVAHITGKINYGLYSSSEASNGLAPVQLSAYLGWGCILFFLTVMNPAEIKNRTLNFILLAFTATVMVLTFSRGGIYFFVAVAALYFYYNRAQFGSYVKLLLLIPIALVVFFFVVDKTGGKIVERYEQEGTSNRDVLVNVGFQLFAKYPFLGVGTGNYNTRIVKENLFFEKSGAHNEFVRAAAEHGVVGIFFYWGFYLLLFLEIINRRQPQKQYALYFFVLFCLIIVHNGLKISIQPLILMLAVGTPSFAIKRQRYVYDKELEERSVA